MLEMAYWFEWCCFLILTNRLCKTFRPHQTGIPCPSLRNAVSFNTRGGWNESIAYSVCTQMDKMLPHRKLDHTTVIPS